MPQPLLHRHAELDICYGHRWAIKNEQYFAMQCCTNSCWHSLSLSTHRFPYAAKIGQVKLKHTGLPRRRAALKIIFIKLVMLVKLWDIIFFKQQLQEQLIQTTIIFSKSANQSHPKNEQHKRQVSLHCLLSPKACYVSSCSTSKWFLGWFTNTNLI